jgi:hypothetical protein
MVMPNGCGWIRSCKITVGGTGASLTQHRDDSDWRPTMGNLVNLERLAICHCIGKMVASLKGEREGRWAKS